jgi:hypothetical protein
MKNEQMYICAASKIETLYPDNRQAQWIHTSLTSPIRPRKFDRTGTSYKFRQNTQRGLQYNSNTQTKVPMKFINQDQKPRQKVYTCTCNEERPNISPQKKVKTQNAAYYAQPYEWVTGRADSIVLTRHTKCWDYLAQNEAGEKSYTMNSKGRAGARSKPTARPTHPAA